MSLPIAYMKEVYVSFVALHGFIVSSIFFLIHSEHAFCLQELKQEELLSEIEQFYSDAATQFTLVAASMVGQNAETVACSSMLLR